MAKKADVTPAAEEVVEVPQPTYEEIHNQTEEEIIDNKPVEPKEPPKEEKKEEPVVEKKPDVDPEKMAEQAAQRAADKIIERMTGMKEKKDEKDEELISPWAKEGRSPKDYDEIADWAMQKKEILDARKAKEEAARQEAQQKEQNQLQEQRTKAFNAQVDAHLDDLYASGKLPAIVNKEDPNDRGVAARKALFQALLESVQEVEKVNTGRIAEGKAPLPYPTLKEVFYEKYKAPGQQPAGANAPVSFGQGAPSTGADEGDGYVYARDHNRSWEDLVRG